MSTERSTEGLSESIAIIGMAGELPGAPDLEAYWRNLCDGVESIKTFSRQELLDAGIPAAALDRPSYVHGAGVISGGEDFDATFFDFNPQEAQILDPNFRLFMEHAWMALENAGYDPFVYPGAIGIFGGMMAPQYLMSNILTHPEVCRTAGDLQLRIFNDKDFLASLTAYKLNLQGPSLSVQTACSTSLVATSLACQSLLSYQCDMALAGGVSVPVPGKIGYVAHEGVFSPDGHCRAFDAGAQGTVAGYGVGLVVLKRLEQAITDGDHVHAVIRGWAVNNDGALKVGYTAPSVDGQAEVVAMAQAMAGIEPETVSYVETHGTATPLGDQIEVAALTEVFRESTDQRGFCALGSVKTNIGHLDAAAGVAGLIKTTLALEHRYLPASLHFEQPSPQIDFDSSPFYVQAQSAPWEGGTAPRRAGVSAFAVGGVNAHLVLEEAPAIEPSDAGRPCQLLVLSARTETALATATTRLADALESAAQPDSASLADIAYTLQVGRRAFEHRFAAVCRTREDAAAVLRNRDPQRLLAGRAQRRDHPVTFLFPGLGNHYVGMARELYRDEPVFRQHLDRCAEVLQPHLGLDLRTVLYPAASEASASDEPVNSLAQMLGRSSSGASAAGELLQTRLAQPVVFSVEYALARLLMAWGVVPESLIGYSIGEYVAACLAGVFSLEDALALVAERARRIDELPAGAMLAIPMAESAVRPLLDENLSITAVNGPQVTVVGGPAVAIDALVRRLEARGEVCRRLETSHAFHSHMMEPILEGFRARVAEIELAPPQIPFLSNVTGTWIRAAEATDPGYWANHLRRPVRYADGIDELWREGDRVLLEVGPGQALSSWALQHPAADRAECAALATLPHAFDRQSDQAFLLTALARLWLLGVEVDWTDFSAGERRHRVPLPTYPFERQRYWLEPRPAAGPEDGIANVAAIGDANESTQGNSELRKAENQSDWFYLPVWQPQSPSLQSEAPDPDGSEVSWLLFLDAEGIGLDLAERLEAEGHEVIMVAAGLRFEKIEGGAYVLDPAAPGAYVELLADLHAESRSVTRVLHLWTTGNATSEPSRATELGLLSLTYLTQAWSAHPTEDRRYLWVISTHLHQITGTDEVQPERATVLGACAVIPKEYAGTACRSVEIALPTGRLARRRLIERLRHELEQADETGPVAWRGNRRWIREFEPVAIDAASDAMPAHLRPQGVYVITGGLGGVGLTLAEELARAVQARLVLVGRSPFPAANEWPQWLTEHPLSDPVSRQIRQLERCQSHGAEILVLAADVTDADAIDSVRQRTLERFGAVHGVIHAAGVPPGGLLEIKTREQLEAVLAPKVRGSRVVAEAFADEDLDFLILCSSLTALTGAFGLVDHTAANACLDAFAQAASTAGSTPVVAINWDAWLDVGQAAAAAEEFGLTSASDDGDSDDGRGEVLRIPDHPLFDACLAEADGKVVYRARLDPTEHWVLDEHRLQSFGVMPATGHLEMVRAAWADHQGDGAVELRQVTFLAPLAIPNGEQREVRVVFAPRDAAVGDGADFTLESRTAEGAQTRHVEGRVLTAEPSAPVPCDLATLRQTLSDRRELPQRSAASEEAPDAFHFGPRWRGLEHDLRWGEAQGLISLHLAPEFAGELDTYHLHPALLDAATAFIQGQDQRTYLPIGYDRLLLRRPLPAVVHSHARLAEEAVADAEAIAGDLVLYDDDGAPVAEIEGFTLRRIDPAAVTAAPATEAAAELVGILPREGAEVFRRLLAMPELPTQILVSTRHFPTLLQASATAAPESHVQYRVDHLHDRSGGTYPRPQLAVQFVAPRDALEEELAVVWRDLLALSEVGAHDSFFDLGGDSLLATRLIGLIRERFDIHLPLRAIFEAPSLAKLALTLREHVADEDDAGANGAGANGTPKSHRESVAEQPLIQGPVPLTPNQMSFFEDYPRNPHRWNVTSLFEVRGGFSTHALRVALGALLYHHDALRSRFFRNGEGWRQEIASPNGAVPFSTADLSALPEDRKRFALEAASELLQASLHLSRGPVLRLVLFDLGGQSYRLLVIGHHLAMDNVSFQIVLEDLQAAYLQALRGEAVRLAPKGSSLKAWSEHLQHHALSAEIEEELGFWLRLPWSAVRGLPFDYPGGENSALSARTVHSELSRQDGERLQHQLPRRHDVTVEEILITALALALARWTGETLQLLSLSHHSRNPLFPDLDISRTVGWFSSTYPALLELDGDPAPAAALQSIAEQLRRLPHKGLSHQILRFLGRDPQSIRQMHALPQPSVAFTYRKLQAADGEGDSMFRLAPEFPGEFVDLSVARPALIYIFASHTPRDGRLELSWNYSNNCHQRATIERLATLFEDAVGSLV